MVTTKQSAILKSVASTTWPSCSTHPVTLLSGVREFPSENLTISAVPFMNEHTGRLTNSREQLAGFTGTAA